MLKVGDVIGFKSKSKFAFFGKIIRFFTKSKIEHVAIITNIIDGRLLELTEVRSFDKKYKIYRNPIKCCKGYIAKTIIKDDFSTLKCKYKLYHIPLKNTLTDSQHLCLLKNIDKDINSKNNYYNWISAILSPISEFLPKSIRKKLYKCGFYTKGRFCSLFIQYHLYKIGKISKHLYYKDYLNDPQELINHKCFGKVTRL